MVKQVENDSLEALESFFSDMDVVLVEGYKQADQLKIEVFDKRSHASPLSLNGDKLIAFVSDDEVQAASPVFGTHQVSELCDLIESKYLLSKLSVSNFKNKSVK
jgi:molybdopterin-guanine dinucleotide biosynthesis protein B